MACCSLCSSICYDALPDLPRPEATSTEYAELSDGEPLWYYGLSFQRKPDDQQPVFQHPYHEHLDALVASAESCSLCALVYRSAEKWLENKRRFDASAARKAEPRDSKSLPSGSGRTKGNRPYLYDGTPFITSTSIGEDQATRWNVILPMPEAIKMDPSPSTSRMEFAKSWAQRLKSGIGNEFGERTSSSRVAIHGLGFEIFAVDEPGANWTSTDNVPDPRGRQLWICRDGGRYRCPDARGFLVFTRKDKNDELYKEETVEIQVLARIGFAVDAKSPLADHISQRPISPYFGSESSLAVASSWLETCIRNHNCSVTEPARLPTRVLDIEESLGGSVRLVETNNDYGNFVALSYCWGASVPYITTKSTVDSHKQRISIVDLPQTIQDAIVITRRLGIRYIWVDALCIIQDDNADWAREAAKMAEVYTSALLVVAVSHAQDASVGCFRERPIPPSASVRLPVKALLSRPDSKGQCPAHYPTHSDAHARIFPLEDWNRGPLGRADKATEPLERRGWTLQESVLARRVLNYTANSMVFHCGCGRVGEDGSQDDVAQMSIKPVGEENVDDLRNLWYRLAKDYSKRRLTKRSDTLPALSGLSRYFNTHIDEPYVAGMWLDETINSRLCWSSDSYGDKDGEETTSFTGTSLSEYTVPTWSWLSSDHPVAWKFESGEEAAKVVGFYTNLKAEANAWGEIVDARLLIIGPFFRLAPRLGAAKADEQWNHPPDERKSRVRHYPQGREDPRNMRVRVFTADREEEDDGDKFDLHMVFDQKATRDSGDWSIEELRVLLICIHQGSGANTANALGGVFGLVITSLNDPKRPELMKRIGTMSISLEDPYHRSLLARCLSKSVTKNPEKNVETFELG